MQGSDHLFLPPDPHLQRVFFEVRDNVEIHRFTQRHMRHLNFLANKRDFAVTIDDAGSVQAEDILEGRVRFWQDKGTEQTVACATSLFKAHTRDFAGGGVNLVIVVSFHFFLQD